MNEIASRKILTGYDDGTFRGGSSITRAEFAKIIIRALGLATDGECSFTDVSADSWYYGVVGKAFEYGIIEGYEDGSFRPDNKITREEAMIMMQRAAAVAEYISEDGAHGDFADMASVSSWAQDAVEFNIDNGFIIGTDGFLRPQDTITRAEAATVVLRLLQKSDLVDVRSAT